MWQKVAKFKGAEYFRKALYMQTQHHSRLEFDTPGSGYDIHT